MAIQGRLGVNAKINMDVRRRFIMKAQGQKMIINRTNRVVPDARTRLSKKLPMQQVINEKNRTQSLGSKSKNIRLNDIRFKLIEKQRVRITDARDKLAEISKKKDARLKLQTIRNMQNTNTVFIRKTIATGRVNRNIKNIVGQEPPLNVSKTIMRRGNLTRTVTGFITKKPTPTKTGQIMQKGPALQRTIQGAARRPAPTRPVRRLGPIQTERNHPLKNNPNVVTIKNEKASDKKSFRSKSAQKYVYPWSHQQFPHSSAMSLEQSPYLQNASQFLGASPAHQNVPFQMAPSIQPNSSYAVGILPPVFQQVQQPMMMREPSRHMSYDDYMEPRSQFIAGRYNMSAEESLPTGLKITAFNNRMAPNTQYEDVYESPRAMPPPKMNSLKRAAYVDYEEEYRPSPPKRSPTNFAKSNFRSGTEGFKVMVTNLHNVVTVDDIRELFGCIGSIFYARMIREGIAEVAFINEEDALRSVEVYHNRQLDQQPMSVVLVTKKSTDKVGELAAKRFSAFDEDLEERNVRAHQRSTGGFAPGGRPDSYGSIPRSPGYGAPGNSNGRSGYGAPGNSSGRPGYGAPGNSNARSGYGAPGNSNARSGYGAAVSSNARTGYGAAGSSNARPGYGGVGISNARSSGYAASGGSNQIRSVPRSSGFDSFSFRSDSRSGNLDDSYTRENSSFLKSASGAVSNKKRVGQNQFSHGKSNRVVPDLDAIHHSLFSI